MFLLNLIRFLLVRKKCHNLEKPKFKLQEEDHLPEIFLSLEHRCPSWASLPSHLWTTWHCASSPVWFCFHLLWLQLQCHSWTWEHETERAGWQYYINQITGSCSSSPNIPFSLGNLSVSHCISADHRKIRQQVYTWSVLSFKHHYLVFSHGEDFASSGHSKCIAKLANSWNCFKMEGITIPAITVISLGNSSSSLVKGSVTLITLWFHMNLSTDWQWHLQESLCWAEYA